MMAWHFTGERLRDGRAIPPVGETLRHDRRLWLCKSGLHASERLIDALQYAPGPMLHRVQLGGEILRDRDKACARERTILWSLDATDVLRAFARRQALSVAHLWDMPQLMREYLETGDERKRNATRAAAWVVAWDGQDGVLAAMTAAMTAARDAAWAAASDAAWDAARAAASDAARDAARAAADAMLTTMVEDEARKLGLQAGDTL